VKDPWLALRTNAYALRRMGAVVGWARVPGLLAEMTAAERRGEPFEGLPPPADAREAECRKQLGQVTLLYDAAARRVAPQVALDLAGELVREGAVMQLRAWIPVLDRAEYQAMSEEARVAFLRPIVERFPNADIGPLSVGDAEFRYPVLKCTFVQLARAIERPEIAALFCAGDAVFFERDLPQIVFERPETLATGGACCDFRFRWRDGS
jgi:hypothetical protein